VTVRRFTLVLAGALLLPTVGAHAQVRQTTWTVTAIQPSSGTFTLSTPVEFRVEQLNFDIENRRRTLDSIIATSGRFGGLMVQDSRGLVRLGLLRYRGFPQLIGWGTSDDDWRQILPAGRYTLTVFGDRRTTIHLPMVGGGSRSLPATRRAHLQLADTTDPDLLRASVPATSLQSARVRIGPHSNYVVLANSTVWLNPAAAEVVCLNESSNVACLGAARMSAGPAGGIGQDWSESSAIFGQPGDIPPGTYDARYQRASAEITATHSLFVAVLD
jgi:hypothetical protein